MLRTAALGALAAITLSACSGASDIADDVQTLTADLRSEAEELVSELDSPTAGSTQTPQNDDGAATSDAEGESTPAPTQTGGNQPGGLTPLDDLGGVGANGRAYLRDDRPAMIVEIDVQEGVSVDQQAVDHLISTLRGVVSKPDGITLSGGNTFSSDRTSWSTADLREAAKSNRSHYSSDTSTAIYLLYVRGGFATDQGEGNALGVAHRASEAAIFPDRWAGLGSLLGSDRAVERAVLVHELGHLFGLVNLTYTSDADREDPDHPGHSSNRASVMHWAIETDLVGQVFSGPPPDRFDDDDRADLEGLRTGRYP